MGAVSPVPLVITMMVSVNLVIAMVEIVRSTVVTMLDADNAVMIVQIAAKDAKTAD